MARKINLSINSRYIKTKLFNQQFDEDDIREGTFDFFGTWTQVVIPESPDDTFIFLKEGDAVRFDALAEQFYGTEELWWVIATVNEVFDPLAVGIESGQELRIPALSTVLSILFEERQPNL